MMKITDIADQVAATRVIGEGNKKQVVVIVNCTSVKAFQQQVIEQSEVHRTKRWLAERDVDNAVKNYVREVAGFHGKRLAGIQVVASTDRPNVYRTRTGAFMKI